MSFLVRIQNGKAKLYDNRSYKRSIGNDVVSADCDDEYVVIVERGRAKQYTTGGSFKRNIVESNAIDVRLNGDSIIVEYANGRAKEYRVQNGAFVRSY